MHVLEMVLRTLIGVPLFLYVPGFLIERRWFGHTGTLGGIERVTTHALVSMMLTSLYALILAEVGWFSYWSLLAASVALCGVAMLIRPPQAPQRSASRIQRFDICLAAIALVFGIVVARPFEVVRGGLDAGIYANTGVSIARTGRIVIHDPIVEEIGKRARAGDTAAQQIASNVLGVQNSQRFEATRLRAAGFFINTGDLERGRIVPQFFHLWPTFIAIWVTMLGSVYGLAATGIAGTLGVVLTGLIGRRIAGTAAGLVAAAFMATMSPQVWFSRMPTSEAFTQVLLVGGCWAFMHFADAITVRQRLWWGAFVGLAFGQLALTRIDFPLALAPIVLLLGYVAISRRWDAGYTAMAGVLGLLLVHSALHIIFIARGYFIDTTIPTLQKFALTITLSWPLLTRELQEYSTGRPGSVVGDRQRLVLEVGVILLLIVGGLLLRQRPIVFKIIEARLRRWRRPLLALVVLGLGLLAAYGYVVRPGILDRATLSDPFTPENWLRLQGYIGAPITIPFDQFPRKQVVAVAQANMVRLGWYLSPLGIVLGVIGGLCMWWNINRRAWLLVVIATIYTFFFVQSLYGTQDQTYIYILRRYVPIVFPAFALGIVYALWPPTALYRPIPGGQSFTVRQLASIRLGRLTRPNHEQVRSLIRRLFVIGRWTLVGLLLLFFVMTGRTVYAHTEYAGMLGQIEALSKVIGPKDVVLLRGGGASDIAVRDTSELIAAPLTYIYGRNAFPVKGRTPGKYPAAFADQVTRWKAEGRRVFLVLSASGGDMLFPGYVPRFVDGWTLRLLEFQQLSNQKPKLSYVNEVPFQLYELVAADKATWPAHLGPDDTASQVTGFYRSEVPAAGEPRVAWTNGAGILRLPASLQGQTITLEVAGGKRPRSIGAASVCPAVAPEPSVYPEGGAQAVDGWIELGCQRVGEKASRLALSIPQVTADTTLLIRLRSDAWVPADVVADPGIASSADRRPLGIQFLGIR